MTSEDYSIIMTETHEKAPDNLTDTPQKKRKLFRPVIIAAAAGIFLFFAVFFVVSPSAFSDFFSVTFQPPKASAADAVPAPPSGPGTKRYDFKLTGNDTFYNVMSLLNVSAPEIHAIAEKARPIYDLRQLRKDTVLRVYTKDDKWARVEYKFGDYQTLVVLADGGIKACTAELPHEKKTVLISGTIKDSLYEDGIRAGADPQLIVGLSDIFAWDIDFAADIRKGDSFSILAEMFYVNGKPVRTGRILGAEMVNDGRKYTAVYFAGPDGTGSYYDADGRSVTRTLLKSPLRYSRISSYFSNRRFNPVLKIYRPHHGIDYAAPRGTPVEAAGDGRVVYAGWMNGFGNFIRVKHNNGYMTGYGHLSRIARGIRRGVRVKQSQVIGFVGSTGISTGPHLHYEVRINNRVVNPLSIKSVPNRSITGRGKLRFASVKDDVINRLDGAMLALSTESGRVTTANASNTPGN